MNQHEIDMLRIVQQVIAQKVAHVFRLLHVFDGCLTAPNDGPLVFVFEDNSLLFLDSGSDDATLKAEETAWVDPFSGSLSDENREWVEKWGKETYFEVSDVAPYHNLIGATVRDVFPVLGPFNVFGGVQLMIDDEYLSFYKWGGHFVVWGEDNPTLREHGFRVACL